MRELWRKFAIYMGKKGAGVNVAQGHGGQGGKGGKANGVASDVVEGFDRSKWPYPGDFGYSCSPRNEWRCSNYESPSVMGVVDDFPHCTTCNRPRPEERDDYDTFLGVYCGSMWTKNLTVTDAEGDPSCPVCHRKRYHSRIVMETKDNHRWVVSEHGGYPEARSTQIGEILKAEEFRYYVVWLHYEGYGSYTSVMEMDTFTAPSVDLGLRIITSRYEASCFTRSS